MRIALHTPMKAFESPVPSGDRQFARLIRRALELEGHTLAVPTAFTTWAPAPEGDETLFAAAAAEAERIAGTFAAGGPPDLWLSYHNYHKAPDLLGPPLAARFGIPYVLIEASRARSRAVGPWAARFAAADAALRAADAVAAVHDGDRTGLADIVPLSRLHLFPPFIDAAPFRPAVSGRAPASADAVPRLLSVGMMRPGDKAQSYRVLAEALAAVADLPWHLTIVGDGPARDEIAPLFDPARTTLVGALAPEALPEVYAAADLFVWPAVGEAFGMVFLEAQAAGLPVVGGDRPGVAAIVRDGETGLLAPEGEAAAFAHAIARLLSDPAARTRMGRAAAAHVACDHDLSAGRARLAALIAAASAAHIGLAPPAERTAPCAP